MNPFLSGLQSPRGLVIGHRGCAAEPENTLPAFERAFREGAHAVECDVRTTRDGNLVVIHDETVTRTTDGACRLPGRERVDALDLSEIRTLDAGAGPVPTLEEVLDLVKRLDRYLNIEVKDAPVSLVLAAVRRVGALDRTILSSFDHAWVREAKRLEPAVAVSALVSDRLVQPGRYVREFVGADLIAPAAWAATSDLFEDCRRAGLPVHVWTVNDPAEVRRLLAGPAHAVFTDHPSR